MSVGRRVEPPPSGASTLALAALVAVAVVSPWFFGLVKALGIQIIGRVEALEIQIISGVALGAAFLAVLSGAIRGGLALPAVPLGPVLALLALGLLQLLPLPAALHAMLAPGSHAVWHPAGAAAAAVLGPGPHPVSVDPAATQRWLFLTAGLIFLAVASAPALTRSGAARVASVAVVLGGLAVSTYGIFARARFGSLLYGRFEVPTVSPFGPFVSKNHFAGYVEMAALLGLGLVIGLADRERAAGGDRDERRPSAAVLALVAALAMSLGVLISASRAGVLSLLAGGFVLFGARLGLRRRSGSRRTAGWVAALGLALLVGILFVAVLPAEIHERMRSLAGADFRIDTWRDALRTAAASPGLGQGLGAFHDAFPRFKQGHGLLRVEHAENDYVEMLVEGGILGLGLTLVTLLVFARFTWRGLSRSPDPLLRGLGIGALGGLAALAVHSTLDFNLRIPSNAALASFLAALACAAAGPRARMVPRGVAACASVVLAVAVGALAGRPAGPSLASAEREVRSASSSASAEVRAFRRERAEAALGSLARARPARAEPWLLLAWTRAAQSDWPAALALSRHAVALDPQRPDLQAEAARLISGAPR